jgi:biotin carboxyl carrier protein
MAIEINIGSKTAIVDLLNRSGNKAIIIIDDIKYEVDIIMVEYGVYSILYNNKSYNVELVEGDSPKKYIVNTFKPSFEIEIIDAESKYLKSREKGLAAEQEKIISAPMPGKVVKLLVAEGQEVQAGQVAIVVEAMKMQNEYQVKIDSKVKSIMVNEGDTVNANQPLIIFE